MITVQELIEALSKFDPDLRVVTPGFDECGLDDIAPPELCKVRFIEGNRPGHCGKHEWGSENNGDTAVLLNFD